MLPPKITMRIVTVVEMFLKCTVDKKGIPPAGLVILGCLVNKIHILNCTIYSILYVRILVNIPEPACNIQHINWYIPEV